MHCVQQITLNFKNSKKRGKINFPFFVPPVCEKNRKVKFYISKNFSNQFFSWSFGHRKVHTYLACQWPLNQSNWVLGTWRVPKKILWIFLGTLQVPSTQFDWFWGHLTGKIFIVSSCEKMTKEKNKGTYFFLT